MFVISEEVKKDKIVVKFGVDVAFDLPHNRIIWDGVVITVKVIDENFIQVGRLLIHRSALQEGGWHEYTFGELGFAHSKSIEPSG